MTRREETKKYREKYLQDGILKILLIDRASKKNIIWATDNYKSRGIGYTFKDNIEVIAITSKNEKVIRPRIEKSQRERARRSRETAEVFTPSWVCNMQNNLVDEAWFGYKNVFNIEKDKIWELNNNKISFPKNKKWKDYVLANRLEISCGEAPYLVSRYDTVSGEIIELTQRIGILDRKLRVVNENTTNDEDWKKWAIKSFQSSYGFDWQGDNVLLARENLLFTYVDYYKDRFEKDPSREELENIAKIISWNIWQMDGTKFVIPESCKPVLNMQLSFFEQEEGYNPYSPCIGCAKNDNSKHTGIYSIIKDWKKNKTITFISLVNGGQHEKNI